MRKFVSFSTLFSALIVSLAFAQIPQTMSYQGVLTGADGNPVADGNVSLTFKLYANATGGTALWEETQQVTTANGLFNAILGSVNPLNLPFDKPYWLGITVGQGSEMTPRIALTASPYSLGATATVTEPAPGQSFVVRAANGDTAHVLSANGNVRHAGVGTFLGGIVVGDTIVVPVDTSGAADISKTGFRLETTTMSKEVGLSAFGNSIGVFGNSRKGKGVQGQSLFGPGVFGFSRKSSGVRGESTERSGVLGKSKGGAGVSGFSTENFGVFGGSNSGVGVSGLSLTGPGILGAGFPAGDFGGDVLIENGGKLKIDDVPAEDSDKFLVWGADKFVKMRSLPAMSGFDGILNNMPFMVNDVNGVPQFYVHPDGTSHQAGLATLSGGLAVPNSDGTTAFEVTPNTNPVTDYAVNIWGNLKVNGMLEASAKNFKIDHPLDPEHKYLTHTSVESPDMKTVYDGVVSLDENGAALVEMPDWFEALNGDFRYQLTAIGAPGPDLYIAEEIQNNRFRIAGGRAGMKVSWQVTGIRHDAWAQEHRQPVEGYK